MNVKRFCIKKFSGLKRPDLGLFLRKNDKIDSARLIFAVESDKGKQTLCQVQLRKPLTFQQGRMCACSRKKIYNKHLKIFFYNAE